MSVDARHNVLVLLADEHDPRVTGMVGHPMVQTPNLDALARRGTRFTNAYTPSPVCVPARAGLATGRWVHDIGYWDNAMGYDGREPGWGHTLQAAGVRVESIGKLHYRRADDPTGFDRQHEPMHLAEGVGQVWGSVRDPAHAQVLREYEAQLRSMLDPEAVDRRAKDDQNALIARVGGRERALQRGPRGATPAPGTPRELPPRTAEENFR